MQNEPFMGENCRCTPISYFCWIKYVRLCFKIKKRYYFYNKASQKSKYKLKRTLLVKIPYIFCMRKIFAIIGALITGGLGIAAVSTVHQASAAVN
jgi:hypothetical protein